MSRTKRIALTLPVIFALVGSTIAFADPDPANTVQNLLVSVSKVEATGIGPDNIFIAWNNSSLLVTRFRIEMAMDEAGPYTKVQDVNRSCQDIASSAANCATTVKLGPDADVRPRFFRVVPLIGIGGQVAPSPVPPLPDTPLLEGKPSDPDPAMLGPKRPTDVFCSGSGSSGDLACIDVNRITLSWTDNSDETWFYIMRAKGTTNPNFGADYHALVPANTTSFSETIGEYSATFQYRVTAVREANIPRTNGNTTLERSFSDCLGGGGKACSVPVQTAPLPSSTAPTSLTAVFIPPSTAKLTWVDKELNPNKSYVDEDGWFIEQTTGDNNWQSKLASQHSKPPFSGQGVVSWVDYAIPPDTSRCYRVRGFRFGPAYSDYSPLPTVEDPVCLGSTPKAPTNLTAVAISNAQVDLAWVDNSNAETHFTLQRCDGTCTDDSTWSDVNSGIPENAQAVSDVTTVGLTTYSYRIFAANFSGRSAASNITTVTTLASPLPVPTGIQALGRSHAIQLNWDDIGGETGYRIEYRKPGGYFQPLTSVGANVDAYLDQDSLDVNQARCYRVRANDGPDRVSDPSSEACATTSGLEPPNGDPTGLTSTVESNTRITLTWTDNATNETAYQIEYIVFSDLACPQSIVDIPFRTLATVDAVPPQNGGPVEQTFSAEKLLPHSAYYFRVKAVNRDGSSRYATATDPIDAGFPSVPKCAQTFGPPAPVFVDPGQNGDLQPIRCDFTIKAPVGATDPDRVGGILVYVNATVPGTGVGNTDTLYVIAPGGTIPGANDNDAQKHYIIDSDHGLSFVASDPDNAPNVNDGWKITWSFRRGPHYRIIAQSYGFGEPYYTSAIRERTDVTVVADCPTNGLD